MPGLTLHSTRSPEISVSLEEAVMSALAPDGGLYMPDVIPVLPDSFWKSWRELSFPEMAAEVAGTLFKSAIDQATLSSMCREALDFPVPVVEPSPGLRVLELFHGPTLAFKDFGARLMSRLMGHFAKQRGKELVILAATSGDTGGAVASAFHHVPGTHVIILYPSGRVSPLQEKQLTTLGGNVTAVEVAGSFDDCQHMVKSAFLDKALSERRGLTSANSINIARLVPQMFYYFEAARALPEGEEPVFVVPSGNFGNLTAGLFAQAMGLPVKAFVAATNINDTVPLFLGGEAYAPKPSVATLSNAMDVGAPSNFERMFALCGSDEEKLRGLVFGQVVSDSVALAVMEQVWREHRYQLDPHTAVGWQAATDWLRAHPGDHPVVLSTAHPSKFLETAARAYGGDPVEIPERLARLANLPKLSVSMAADPEAFKDWLAKGGGASEAYS
ncbi:MAG: threonine synthase [Verrucomicrobiales bacterium]